MNKITIHNYIKILYNMSVQIDLEGGSEEFRKEKIRKAYVNRVLNDHMNDDAGREKMLCLLEDSVEDFINLYYRYIPKKDSRCCCFS